MKTGILGGTFDPIHTGHLILAETAYDSFGLDRVLLIPAGHSYFKDKREDKVSSPEDRLALLNAAARDNSHFEISDIELRRPGNSYTCDTLEELHRLYPEDTFFFIVGADTLCSMHTWRAPERIFSDCCVLVAVRQDQISEDVLDAAIERLTTQYQAKIEKMPVRNIEISSTDIRKRIREGRSVKYLVPPGVEEMAYIYKGSR